MKLLKKIKKLLPDIRENENKSQDEIKVPLKLFNPCGSQTWYITEFDGIDCMFGYVNLGDSQCAELGYVSLKELENLSLPFGLKIERDIHWDENTTLKQVIERVQLGQCI